MTSTVPVSELNEMIGEFAVLISAGMKRSVKKHFREYMLGIMIPPEIRRKSKSNISVLVSGSKQGTINREFHDSIQHFLRRTIYIS